MLPDIMCSLVWEDPAVELALINKFIGNKPCNILTVASGGCTLFTLLCAANIQSIDVIDINQHQLYLCALKLGVIRYFKNYNDVLNFFEGLYSKDIFVQILNKIKKLSYISNHTYDFWIENIDSVACGLNKIGKYEMIFQDLIKSNYDFDNIFSYENLEFNFGKKAISKTFDYVNKFRNIFYEYEQYNLEENQYYHQIIHNSTNRNILPIYLRHIHKINKVPNDKIHMIHNDINDYIKTVQDQTYNFINLSNITDLMSNENIDFLLQQIYRVLCHNGCVVIRRMVLKNDIKKIAAEYFEIIDNTNYPNDSSFFNDVICCRKI